jgi:hypothetical protein
VAWDGLLGALRPHHFTVVRGTGTLAHREVFPILALSGTGALVIGERFFIVAGLVIGTLISMVGISTTVTGTAMVQ